MRNLCRCIALAGLMVFVVSSTPKRAHAFEFLCIDFQGEACASGDRLSCRWVSPGRAGVCTCPPAPSNHWVCV
jgi:hypothetical protein